MIISFVWPSTPDRTMGVRVLWELANGLARRGHEVHFVHGPAWPMRINSIDELPAFAFEASVQHHIVDVLDDASVPVGDVVFHASAPEKLGLPVVMVQGYRMFPQRYERDAFRARMPKVCVAKWLIDVAREFGVPEAQLWHVPLGMDHEMFALRTPLGQRPYDLALLYHVHVQKGWEPGLAALRDLRQRNPNFRAAVFCIDPPPDELPPGVDLHVGLNHRRLTDEVYNQTKVFLQPSFQEGFGYTAVEAMACGAALVTTDNGGSRDYALPGETALIVEPGDVGAMVEGVETLLANDELRQELATAGERYVRRFDWDLSSELLEHNLERYVADPEAYRMAPVDARPAPDAV